jgi:hypothetical protein
MKRISFDFDSTLSEVHIQLIAKSFINIGIEVFVITSRCSNGVNKDLFEIVDKLGISRNKVILTKGSFKWRKIKELNIDLHFDDVPEECESINKNGGKSLLIWDDICKESIKSDSFGKGIF